MELEWINQYWPVIIAVAIWELSWKGVALWKAARNRDKPWFVILFLVNSIGILPIIYIYIFGKRQKSVKSES